MLCLQNFRHNTHNTQYTRETLYSSICWWKKWQLLDSLTCHVSVHAVPIQSLQQMFARKIHRGSVFQEDRFLKTSCPLGGKEAHRHVSILRIRQSSLKEAEGRKRKQSESPIEKKIHHKFPYLKGLVRWESNIFREGHFHLAKNVTILGCSLRNTHTPIFER